MDKKAMRTMTIAVAAAMCFGTCLARPHGGPHGGPGPRPMMRPVAPIHHHHHHHHRGGVWGRGGRNFWPGFVGGVVGGILTDTIVSPAPVVAAPVVVNPAPVVVTPPPVVVAPQPVYTTQNVWVEGRYVDQVQANGTVVRVWQPGHYEQRQVQVQ